MKDTLEVQAIRARAQARKESSIGAEALDILLFVAFMFVLTQI